MHRYQSLRANGIAARHSAAITQNPCASVQGLTMQRAIRWLYDNQGDVRG